VLIVRGQNHDPSELERALWGLPGVRTGCAAAVSHRPDTAESEQIWLFVERSRSTSRGARREIEEGCKQEILKATAVAVDRVVVLEPGTLPRTSSGKVRRAEALRRYLAGELFPPEGVSPLLLAKSWLQSSWAFLRWRLRRQGG
jgi:acyl-CoA synthetase (AMP-forming)/AMP-acid ligase II